jgi:DNA polymerase-3 subunit gamma/tau
VIAQKSEGCMRDALSILDKIVSFTNGELNYATTLEHLNILDADYYFKLLDCMQQQDLSGAMLLYDDINRKGFEGDLVVNGFAEFIRNLLVCKDEKAAGLLEVVESFKDKYISTAKNISPVLLISALNILNNTEINYKAARNKRLHVELALIKLCYLQQAIELTSEGGSISKKKIIESATAFRTATIKPFDGNKKAGSKFAGSSERSSEVKLIIETPRLEKISVAEETPDYNKQEAPSDQVIRAGSNQQPATSFKISPLDKIRKQYKSNGNNGNGNTNHPLKKDYVQKLKESKNSAAISFEMALLRIKDENSFEAVTTDNIQKQFIEHDRNKLFSFLQERLQNRLLQFNVIIEENAEGKPEIEISLTAKEQFLKMAEQYPLVKELKDRLRLELDY